MIECNKYLVPVVFVSDESDLIGLSPLLKNLDNDDPISSPIRPMSPETREIYDMLSEPGFGIEDVVKENDFMIGNKEGAQDDSETDCESYDEIETLTQIEKNNIQNKHEKQGTTSTENEKEKAGEQEMQNDKSCEIATT